MAKARKKARRYPSGQLHHSERGEKPDQIKATVMGQPHRRGATIVRFAGREIKRDDPLWGYALGRLFLAGLQSDGEGITERQYQAGMRWAELHIRHSRYQGFSDPNPRSSALIAVAHGLALEPEPDEDVIIRIRRQWSDAYRALADRATDHGHPSPYQVLRDVTISDAMPRAGLELGNLRIALNALAHLWRQDA